jgi:hypothetical protein
VRGVWMRAETEGDSTRKPRLGENYEGREEREGLIESANGSAAGVHD